MAPLIAECFINLECKVKDTRLVDAYGLFILEVLKAWVDPKQKNPKTIHHRGYGKFAVDGKDDAVEVENALGVADRVPLADA